MEGSSASSPGFIRRRPRLALALVVLLVLSGWRLYREYVPAGGQWWPVGAWLLDPVVEVGELRSPGGQTVLYLVFMDAGAAHSDNFWTVIYRYDWLVGRTSVAEGFSAHDVRYERDPLPIQWLDEHSFRIGFVGKRRDGPVEYRTIHLD
ncbi:MAG: hypothetical protein VX951_07340 [Planctomycetota bacterium]|nr:hypothetical protein [Planctomycetota bacterium]